MSITHITTRAAFVCAMALLSGSAFAVTTLNGTTVKYTFDETALGYFGSASVVGDSLVFAPSGFTADAQNPWVGQQLNVTVEALNPLQYQLASFSLAESGGYSGYASSLGNVVISGQLKAIDIEGNTSNQIASAIAASALANGSGTWTGAAAINLPASGWGGVDGIVGKVELQLFNDLIATDAAAVWKTAASLSVVTSPVPEAETTTMLLAGLGLVGFMARRRSLA